MPKVYVFSICFFLICLTSLGQNKYFVYFKDKANTEYSLSKPEEFLSNRSINRRKTQSIALTQRDLPPNKSYVSQIKNAGVKVLYTSRWMNAVLIETTESKLNTVKNLSFVKGVESNGDIRGLRNSTDQYLKARESTKFGVEDHYEYGTSKIQIDMLGVNKMHQKGFTGKGILIGVLDSGFKNANTLSFFSNLFQENRVVDTYDFVNKERSVYEDDSHGTAVLSCMAASEQGRIIGTAPEASYALLRTEDVNSETRIEEVYWLIAAEYSDSLGVDVINSSLGYNTFDNASQNYSYQDMNGDKSIVSRAADWAVAAGIIVVVSAGNEGNKTWKYISTPADADSVISVGAVDAGTNYAAFSSVGPSSKGSIKPELAARGASTAIGTFANTVSVSNGTSFSSPLMAGMVAGLKQAFPQFTAMELRDFMIRSGSQYTKPDIYLGYGIPNFEKAADLAQKALDLVELEKVIKDSGKDMIVFPNPVTDFSNLSVYISKKTEPKELFRVKLFDSQGKLLWEDDKDSKLFSLPAELSALPAGVYQLKVHNDQLNLNSRIVKE